MRKTIYAMFVITNMPMYAMNSFPISDIKNDLVHSKSTVISVCGQDVILSDRFMSKISELSDFHISDYHSQNLALTNLRDATARLRREQLANVQHASKLVKLLEASEPDASRIKGSLSDWTNAISRMFPKTNASFHRKAYALLNQYKTKCKTVLDNQFTPISKYSKLMVPESVSDVEKLFNKISDNEIADSEYTESLFHKVQELKDHAQKQNEKDKAGILLCLITLRQLRCQNISAEDKWQCLKRSVHALVTTREVHSEYLLLLDEIVQELPTRSEHISEIKQRAQDIVCATCDASYAISCPHLFPSSFWHKLWNGW